MPLPDPDYLTDEYHHWNGLQFPSILVKVDGTTNHMFKWDNLSLLDKTRVHTLIMAYADKEGVVTETTAPTLATLEAWAVADFNGTVVGGNSTGLANDATVHTCTVTIDGTPIVVDVVGSAAQTFTTLVAEINTDLGASGTAAIDVNGNIDITSVTADNTSTVVITDGSLFRNLTGFAKRFETYNGITIFEDIFTYNELFHNQTYANVYVNLYHAVTDTPPRLIGPFDINSVYFNHGTAVWTNVYNDVAA